MTSSPNHITHVRRWGLFAGTVALMIVSGAISCVDLTSGELTTRIHVTGPLYGYVENERSVAGYTTPDGELVSTSSFQGDVRATDGRPMSYRLSVDSGSYSAHFTVTEPGPAFLTVTSVEEGSGGLFGGSDETKGRAVFVIAAPVGATMKLAGDNGQDVGDLRLEIDREGDGLFDHERTPDFVKTGDDLSTSRGFRTTASVESHGPAEALVSLATHGTVPAERIYYWTFPNDPIPRQYEEPFIITQPSYLMFASLDHDGNIEEVQEARLLDGAPDITASLELNEDHVIHFDEAGRVAKLTFEGREGQRIVPEVTTSNLGPFACCSGRMQVFGPDGEALTAEFDFGNRPGAMETLVLPGDGVYTLTVNPYLAYTGEVTVKLMSLRDVTATIQPDGDLVTVNFEHAEQLGLITFEGRANQQMSVVVERPESSRCCTSDVTISSPSGELLANGGARVAAEKIVTLRVTLPVDGTYTIKLTPRVDVPGNLTVGVHTVSDIEGHIELDAPPQTVGITTPGQLARLTFSGSAGQQLYVSVIDDVADDDFELLTYYVLHTRLSILDADNTGELVRAWLSPFGTSVVAATLPYDGEFTVELDPALNTTGSLEISLHSTGPESPRLVAEAIPADGTAISVSIDDPRQREQRSFTGMEGQLLTLQIDEVTGAGSDTCCAYKLRLFAPDGEEPGLDAEIDLGLFGSEGMSAPLRLPATGVYVLDLESYEGDATGSFSVSLDPVADVALTATVDGPPLTIATTAPGQIASVTFTAGAGELIVSASMPEESQETDWYVYYSIPGAEHPKGWGMAGLQKGWSNADRWKLPTDGEYTIQIEPSRSNTTFTMTLSLARPPEPVPTPEPEPIALTINGPPAPADLTHDGRPAASTFTFNGEAGQQVTVEARMTLAIVGRDVCCGYELALFQADGTEIASTPDDNGNLRLDATLPVTGLYEIRLRAIGYVTRRFQVSVADVSTP